MNLKTKQIIIVLENKSKYKEKRHSWKRCKKRREQQLTLARWADIYTTGAVPFLWSHNLISPSCAVANRKLERRFQRTCEDPTEKPQIVIIINNNSFEPSRDKMGSSHLPTALSDWDGRLGSLMSQIWMKVSMEHDANKFGSNLCQFTSLTPRVWEFKECRCSKSPLAHDKTSTRWLLWNQSKDRRWMLMFYLCSPNFCCTVQMNTYREST